MNVPDDLLLGVVELALKPEELKQLMGIRPINIDLVKERVLCVLPLAGELLDHIVGAGLLRSKLVARECQDLQALLRVLLVELTHERVGSLGEPALRSHVHEKRQLFALEDIAELLDNLAVNGLNADVMHTLVSREGFPSSTLGELIELFDSDSLLAMVIILLDGLGFRAHLFLLGLHLDLSMSILLSMDARVGGGGIGLSGYLILNVSGIFRLLSLGLLALCLLFLILGSLALCPSRLGIGYLLFSNLGRSLFRFGLDLLRGGPLDL